MSVGLDLGTYAIKAVELKKKGQSFEVVKVASVLNSVGSVIPADAKSRAALVEQMYQFFKEYQLPMTGVNIAIPESYVATKIISMPTLSEAELASAISWQAEQYIPIPIEKLQLEYQVLYRPPKGSKENMRVLLVGVQKDIVEQFSTLFVEAGIEIQSLETQTLALFRSLVFQQPTVPTLFVHIGASAMDFIVYKDGELAFVYSHPNGGTLLTRSLERGLGFDTQQAEEYKRTYGLDEQKLEGKLYQVMLPVFKSFISEIQKAIQYFNAAHPATPIKRIVCSGGTALLPNFISLVASTLGEEVSVCTPFNTMTFHAGVSMQEGDMPTYSVAVGLAMR